jgi:hypothetical protein
MTASSNGIVLGMLTPVPVGLAVMEGAQHSDVLDLLLSAAPPAPT